LRLLEPDSSKRISAREALRSDYFQVEERPEGEANFLHYLEKIRSESGLSFPSQSCHESIFSNGSLASTGSNFFSHSSKNISQDSLQLPRNRCSLLKGLKGKPWTSKNVSFADQFSNCSQSTELHLDKGDDHDGELSEDDSEIEKCNVKAFMDSHYIQISMKNPGKFYF